MKTIAINICDNCRAFSLEPAPCPECKGTVFTRKYIILSDKECDLIDGNKTTVLDTINARKPKK